MIPHALEYVAPESVEEACAALADDVGRSQILAGGTWVVPELVRGSPRVRRVIDVRHAGLSGVSVDGDSVRIGATTAYSGLLTSEVVAAHVPLLRAMADGITGGSQIRSQGTTGGSLMAARAASDAPAALVALGAKAVLRSAGGERVMAVGDLLAGDGRSNARADEVLTWLEVPRSPGAGFGYRKLRRGESSWPIVTAAAIATQGVRGTAVRVAVGGAYEVPACFTIRNAPPLRDAAVDAQLRDLMHERRADAVSDELADAWYRRRVAPVIAARAIVDAVERLEGDAVS